MKNSFIFQNCKMKRIHRPKHDSLRHPGFKSAAYEIAREYNKRHLARRLSLSKANSILAASTRRSSPAARLRNPRLLRVR